MTRRGLFTLPRRAFLRAAGTCALALPTGMWGARAGVTADGIAQPNLPTAEAFIERAFAMRQQAIDSGDQPYGAVVVLDGLIVGQSQSLVVINGDPTAHAEMAAIRDATRRLGRRALTGATLYSSSNPCAMCEAAAYWARIDQMVFGRALANGGRPHLCA